jgi:hypothetical protein
MRLIQQEIFTIDELDTKAKNKAIEYARESLELSDPDWIIEEFTSLLEKLGFSDVKIYYSGFYSQGDGACLTGRYSYDSIGLDWIKENWPEIPCYDTIQALQELGKVLYIDYDTTPKIYHSGRYYHSNTMYTEYDSSYQPDNLLPKIDSLLDEFLGYAKELAGYLYEMLEDDYNDCSSEESIIEFYNANDYEFYADGTKFTGK